MKIKSDIKKVEEVLKYELRRWEVETMDKITEALEKCS